MSQSLVELIRMIVTEEFNARVPQQLMSFKDAEEVKEQGREHEESDDEDKQEVSDVQEFSSAGAVSGPMGPAFTQRQRK